MEHVRGEGRRRGGGEAELGEQGWESGGGREGWVVTSDRRVC